MRYLTAFFFLISTIALAQNDQIQDALKKYNDDTVPYITVDTLSNNLSDYILLDTRTRAEFEVSHLPNAIWVGQFFKSSRIENLDKSQKVVVYCSIGVRSENYGEKLLEQGFKTVYNLQGGLFTWFDAGYKVVDLNGNTTHKVHTYSKKWSEYIKNGDKVY
ncbi:rhodanese-like domain-containing protein [Nonlabens sp. SCSIO 43208]|uniref:rhodanese-like domain-containing protein n=1 Tax=Nonlabens sp. SCSIO 43208 TaxID=2793009 RepID=UPI003D6C5B6E